MAKNPAEIRVGEDFALKEVPRWRMVAYAVFWGIISSLLAAIIIWCVDGFAVPETCRFVGELIR